MGERVRARCDMRAGVCKAYVRYRFSITAAETSRLLQRESAPSIRVRTMSSRLSLPVDPRDFAKRRSNFATFPKAGKSIST